MQGRHFGPRLEGPRGQIDTLRKQIRAARADHKVTLDEVKQLEQTVKAGPAVK